MKKISLIILAGGQSKRIGGFKPLIKLGEQSLIEWVIDNVKNYVTEIIISTHTKEQKEQLMRNLKNNFIFVSDISDEESPLIGILSALPKTTNNLIFIIGCDVPFFDGKIIKKFAVAMKNHNAVIPIWPNGYIEPLVALYYKPKIELAISNALKIKEYAIHKVIRSLKIKYIPVAELTENPEKIFLNINNKSDLDLAKKILGL